MNESCKNIEIFITIYKGNWIKIFINNHFYWYITHLDFSHNIAEHENSWRPLLKKLHAVLPVAVSYNYHSIAQGGKKDFFEYVYILRKMLFKFNF